jgi:hypothetical protein
MVDKDFLLQKIWGSWTGKVAGGTFGTPSFKWMEHSS